MAEGARLESVYTGNRIGGSNPPPSASHPGEAVSSGHRAANPRKTGPVSRSIGIRSSRTREHLRQLTGFAVCSLRERDARVSLAETGNFCDFGPKTGGIQRASQPMSRESSVISMPYKLSLFFSEQGNGWLITGK